MVNREIDAQARVDSGVGGNINQNIFGGIGADREDGTCGPLCNGWQSLVENAISRVLDPYTASGKLCLQQCEATRSEGWFTAEHYWIVVKPAFNMSDLGVTVDPWPSGGRELTPANPYTPDIPLEPTGPLIRF